MSNELVDLQAELERARGEIVALQRELVAAGRSAEASFHRPR